MQLSSQCLLLMTKLEGKHPPYHDFNQFRSFEIMYMNYRNSNFIENIFDMLHVFKGQQIAEFYYN